MPLTYAIGDLHGRSDLLLLMLRRIRQHRAGEPRRLVLLGDYVDKGLDSAGVVWLLRLVQSQDPGGVVCLAGNHDDMLVQAPSGPESHQFWVERGGRATLASYGAERADDIPEDDRAWLAALPTLYQDDHRIYVHAGLRPGVPIEPEIRTDRLWIREPFLSADYDFGKHVVHGHMRQRSGEPDLRRSRSNLDTDAWRSGILTAGVFDDAASGGPVEVIQATGSAAN
ncbi:Bis(5'-nucleosyl)-tetraphosphatase, symmetrical [Methylobacterium crusticola]|uniref:Bis(5'-nucleosyl)-tetraphosphatase, symmetrical n=1 Tax=Methylobacterium crusticola TaxID=1697972 RepID=A0ABQ4R881_9HYPH|nr:metallophosphoesterase [Methylobacterium crusticola]GJD53883.1 Bis(5'-nucleosyl)-tetraphosphatase, symmetrical [Methylobacterium crusticola]